MRKLIVFVVLFLLVCGALVFWYLDRDNIRVVNKEALIPHEVSLATENKKLTTIGSILPTRAVGGKVKISAPTESSLSEKRKEGAVEADGLARIEKKVKSELASEPKPVDDDGVPDSYPIEEAELYFVPREDRYPGNIGGPPPLNLPDPEFEQVIEEGASPALPGGR